MKATFSFRFLASSAIFFLFVINILGQEERPGIECGCAKTGKYVEPGLKKILVDGGTASNEGSSSKGKYKLYATDASDVAPDAVNITITCNGKTIYNENNSAISWGFSPDEDRFVMFGQDKTQFWIRLVNLNPDPDKEGEPAAIVPNDETKENLFSATNLSSANVSFSPHGKYLLFAAIENASAAGPRLNMHIFNSKTGDAVFDIPTTSVVGYASGKSVAGWGFSPDDKDATFVHAFQTSALMYSLRVYKLTATSHEEVLSSDENPGQARFLFSPCGDYFVWVHDTPIGFRASFYKTIQENAPNEMEVDAEMYKYFSYRADNHYIV